LDYTIDLTKEGLNQHQGQHAHNYYGSGYEQQSASAYGWDPKIFPTHQRSQFWTNVACVAIFAVIVYAIYKTCIAPGEHGFQRRYLRTFNAN